MNLQKNTLVIRLLKKYVFNIQYVTIYILSFCNIFAIKNPAISGVKIKNEKN